MKITRHIFAFAPLFAAISAFAQFDQTISVDGKYVPEVIRIDRINTFPRQEKFSMETTPLAYEAAGIPASFAPALYPMTAMGWRDTRKVSSNRGYLDFGMGSWLNSTLSAGYRFLQDESTVFGVRLQHNSTSLWKPDLSPATAENAQYRYDEALGLYFSRLIAGKGRLEAAADYHLGMFNYYAFNPVYTPLSSAGKDSYKAPEQTLNDAAVRIDWHSLSEVDNLSWNVGGGVRYFGYDKFHYFTPSLSTGGATLTGSAGEMPATKETDINIRGGVRFPLAASSAVGIDINADYFLYSGGDKDGNIFQKPDSYMLATLTPYYRFSINRLNLRLGVDIDIAANAGLPDNRYSAAHFATDVTADYDAGAARLFLHLLGGSRLNTLAGNAELDYYQSPFMRNTTPVYSPLDGEFGVSFGPFSGFEAGLGFAFRISRGEHAGGWYQDAMNGLLAPGMAPTLPSSQDGAPVDYSNYALNTYNLHGYSLKANIGYDFGKPFKISANGSYQPQNGSNGYFNGLDRPRWVTAVTAQTNPWNSLKFSISYRYRGVRNAYITGEYRNAKGFMETLLVSQRLRDITSLDFGASYSFTDSFSLWLQADNLLNQHIDVLPGLPSQGITFAGGVSLLF